VSRLWPDRVSLAITPARIVLVRTHGLLRPKVVAKSSVAVPGAGIENGWQPALDTLAKIMRTDAQWQAAAVDVVVSNHFVRYQIIPWSAVITSAAVRAAYVRESFAQVYGDSTATWAYSVSTTRHGAAWFASAIDQPLLTQLEDAVGQGQSKLRSVVPYLMPAFNRARRMLKEKNMWFVQMEANKLLLMLVIDGRWQAVSGHQVSAGQWQTQLPLLLEREWHLHGSGSLPRKVVISAPDTQPVTLDDTSPWVFDWLQPVPHPGLSASTDSQYAMALGV
jgi:hypothetical protein